MQRRLRDGRIIVANSKKMKEVILDIERGTEENRAFVLRGPHGSGKKMLVSLFYEGLPEGVPFVHIDCEKKEMTNDELSQRFHEASNGVLLLENIERVPLEAAKIIKAYLRQRVYQQFGRGAPRLTRTERRIILKYLKGIEPVRIVGITSITLTEAESALKRLKLGELLPISTVPPLVQRIDDIPELVGIFSEEGGIPNGHTIVSDELISAITQRCRSVAELKALVVGSTGEAIARMAQKISPLPG